MPRSYERARKTFLFGLARVAAGIAVARLLDVLGLDVLGLDVSWGSVRAPWRPERAGRRRAVKAPSPSADPPRWDR